MTMNDFIRQEAGRGQPQQQAPAGISPQQEDRIVYLMERGGMAYSEARDMVLGHSQPANVQANAGAGTARPLPQKPDMNYAIRKAAGRL